MGGNNVKITDFFSLLGGLALFLYGMQMMSNGLEAAAGNKMKQILEGKCEKNRNCCMWSDKQQSFWSRCLICKNGCRKRYDRNRDDKCKTFDRSAGSQPAGNWK